MFVKKCIKYIDSTAFHIMEKADGYERTVGWVHYLHSEQGFRYSLSGPLGTHARAKELIQTYILEEAIFGEEEL